MKENDMRGLLIALTVLGFSAGAHAADYLGDPAAGKKMAASVCSECHDTTGNAKPQSPPGNAPPFLLLAQSRDQTPEKMRRYLRLPHGRMVNVLVTGRDADDVVSYIVSLRRQ